MPVRSATRSFVPVVPSLAPSLRDALPSGMVAVMSDGPGMVTIVRSRYGGIYEPGEWIAFACWPDQIPPEWNVDDVTCAEFFADRRGEVGGGEPPQEAYEDLVRLLGTRSADSPGIG